MRKIFEFAFATTIFFLINISTTTAYANLLEQDIIPSEVLIFIKREDIYDYTGKEYKRIENSSIKILDKAASQILPWIDVSYYPDNDEVIEKFSVQLIRPDGTTIDLSNRMEEIPPSSENTFNYLKRIKLIESDFQKGNIINWHFQVRNRIIEEEGFCEKKFINNSIVFIKNRKIVVKTPLNKELYYKSSNINLDPSIEKIDNAIIYTWEINDNPPFRLEENMNVSPFIEFSSLSTWEMYSNWLKTVFNEEKYQLTSTIKSEVEKITSTGNLEQNIKSLYDYVNINIKYKYIERSYKDGYVPTSAITTFDNKYGDCKAQSVLLIALLMEIGVDAELAFINTSLRINPDFTIVSDKFDHVIVYLPELDLFLDPSTEITKYGDLPPHIRGKDVFLPFSNRFLKTPVEPIENKNIVEKKIVLNKKGIDNIFINQQFTGSYECYHRKFNEAAGGTYRGYWLSKTEELFPNYNIKYLFINGMNDINQDINITISLSKKEDMDQEKTERGLTIRPLGLPLDRPDKEEGTLDDLFKNEKRIYPLDLFLRHNFIRQVEIVLPEGYKTVKLPEEVFMKNEVGLLRFESKVEDHKVMVDFQLKINELVIKPEEYSLAKNLVEKAAQIINEERVIVY
jgi:hypothetical protein